MPNAYVEDYEQLTGQTKDVDSRDADSADEAPEVTAKVVAAPPQIRPAVARAETK